MYISFHAKKGTDCKSHPKWGIDDQVSFPALVGTAKCNTCCMFLCLTFNDDRKKHNLLIFKIIQASKKSKPGVNLSLALFLRYS